MGVWRCDVNGVSLEPDANGRPAPDAPAGGMTATMALLKLDNHPDLAAKPKSKLSISHYVAGYNV